MQIFQDSPLGELLRHDDLLEPFNTIYSFIRLTQSLLLKCRQVGSSPLQLSLQLIDLHLQSFLDISDIRDIRDIIIFFAMTDAVTTSRVSHL